MILSDSVTIVISQLGLECKAAMQSCTALFYLHSELLDSVIVVFRCVCLVIWIVAL